MVIGTLPGSRPSCLGGGGGFRGMGKTRVGVEFWVDYAHSLMGHAKCSVRHGHTGQVIVEVEGEVKGGKSFEENVVMDFGELKRICEETLRQIDHKDLDEVFEYPTTENITHWLFNQLSKKLPVVRITFFEGKGKWCTVEK